MYHEDLEVMKINPKINATEFYVLSVLMFYHQNKIPQIIFKREESSTIKKAIRSLKSKKLIVKIPNLMDMRQRFITVTEIGREVYEVNKSKVLDTTS